MDEAITNLNEAIELYYENEENIEELNYYKNFQNVKHWCIYISLLTV